jgi:uncharacterized protein (UPF0333 family)
MRFQFKIANSQFNVTLESLLVLCGVVIALLMLSAYVGAVQESGRSGEAFHAAQRAGAWARSAAVKPGRSVNPQAQTEFAALAP